MRCGGKICWSRNKGLFPGIWCLLHDQVVRHCPAVEEAQPRLHQAQKKRQGADVLRDQSSPSQGRVQLPQSLIAAALPHPGSHLELYNCYRYIVCELVNCATRKAFVKFDYIILGLRKRQISFKLTNIFPTLYKLVLGSPLVQSNPFLG